MGIECQGPPVAPIVAFGAFLVGLMIEATGGPCHPMPVAIGLVSRARSVTSGENSL
jgi:hypothetical protein